MKRHTLDPHASELSGTNIADRPIELATEHWNRGKSAALTANEGIDFNDEHWAVIIFMRKYHLKHGLPINARKTARALDMHLSRQGGNNYLRRLFNGEPVTQGSRLGNVPIPACATDPSFGTSY